MIFLKYLSKLAIILTVMIACSSIDKKSNEQEKIKELVLHHVTSFKTDEVFEDLSKVKYHSFSDPKTLSLLEKAKPTSEFFLWKGGIGGIILYENGDSIKLKVSRHDAYFINMKNNQSYTFSEFELKTQWRALIDSFLNMPSSNT